MTDLTPVAFNFDGHELTRLSAVLTACGTNLNLVTPPRRRMRRAQTVVQQREQ